MKHIFADLKSFDDNNVEAMGGEKIQEAIEKIKHKKTFSADTKVAVALSAGRDSVCLLDIVTKIVKPENILAIHVHHNMRKDGTAEQDAEHAKQISQKLKTNFKLLYLPEKQNPTYDWARLQRRKMIKQAAKDWGGDQTPVLVAHSLTDQAETVLMRAMTSPGISSLAAMKDFEKDENIYRPLFWAKFHRTDCTAYCLAKQLVYRDDPTNNQSKRGQIRNILFQMQAIDERTVSSLLNTSIQARQDETALKSWAKSVLEKEVEGLKQSTLQDLPISVAKRVARMYAESFVEQSCPKASQKIDELLNVKKHKQVQVGNNIAFFLNKKGVFQVEVINKNKLKNKNG